MAVAAIIGAVAGLGSSIANAIGATRTSRNNLEAVREQNEGLYFQLLADQRAREAESFAPLLIGGAVVLIVALVVAIIFKRKT